jgi:hypothetical protein
VIEGHSDICVLWTVVVLFRRLPLPRQPFRCASAICSGGGEVLDVLSLHPLGLPRQKFGKPRFGRPDYLLIERRD